MADMKTCRECGEEKLLEEFKKHARNPSGYDTICKACHRVYDATDYATPEGKARNWWRGMNNRKRAEGIEIRMTRQEWLKFAVPILTGFEEQYGEMPAIWRKDSEGHFEIPNLEIITESLAKERFGELMADKLTKHPNKYKAGKYGLYVPLKGRGGKTLRWRSTYELAAFVKLDSDPDVFCYYVESERFKYRKQNDNNHFSTYIVDLFVMDRRGQIKLLEIKPHHLLHNEIVIRKAKAVLATKKWNYKIWTERHIFPAASLQESKKKAAAFSRSIEKGATYKWSDLVKSM